MGTVLDQDVFGKIPTDGEDVPLDPAASSMAGMSAPHALIAFWKVSVSRVFETCAEHMSAAPREGCSGRAL